MLLRAVLDAARRAPPKLTCTLQRFRHRKQHCYTHTRPELRR